MNNETILKMQQMRLPAFVENYRDQLEHPELYDHMTFAERLTLMVDAEYCARENNKINRLMKLSNIPERAAHMGGIEYLPDRHLNRDLLEQLWPNDYIRKGLNVMLEANNKEAYDEIADEIFKLREQREKCTFDTAARNAQIARINELQDFIKQQPAHLEAFDEALVKRWLERIIVWDDRFIVELKSGLKINIEG